MSAGLLAKFPAAAVIAAATAACVLGGAGTARADLIASAVSCLESKRNDDNTWGDAAATGMRDTAVVLNALRVVGQASSDAAIDGRAALTGEAPPNLDYLARKITALSGFGGVLDDEVDALVAAQLPAAQFLDPNFPEGGWGAASDFGTETLTTTLALGALRAAGVSTALTVLGDVVTAPGQRSYGFSFPAGGDGLTLIARSITGTIRVLIDTPSGQTFQLQAGTPFSTAIVEQTGSYTVRVQSVSGSPNTFSLEIVYEAGGFDNSRIPRALRYLEAAQNEDGGWGLRRGEASTFMVTAEVTQTLLALGTSLKAPPMLAGALEYLTDHQNDDGGFGQGDSTVYETALALLALRAAGAGDEVIDPAAAWLGQEQDDDGCWNDDAYATAVAMAAIFAPDDGLFCNGVEVCNLVEGCTTRDIPQCDDDVSCTVDACDEAADQCSHTASDLLCSDGVFCNGGEKCDAQEGCGPAHPDYTPDCNDNVECTVDTCIEATDSCSNVPSNAACDDGLFCTGTETCGAGGCETAPRDCDDEITCTTDSCNEQLDTCSNVPSDAACNDGQYCNGQEVCSLLTGCTAINVPACGDSVSCTIDGCNESTDSCQNTPSDAACDDQMECSTETCHPTLGCQVDDSGCTEGICGDNAPNLGEQCDDGNTDALDGCDGCCSSETIVSETVGAGGDVSTDAGSGTSAQDPVVAAATTPAAGLLELIETCSTTTEPRAFEIFGPDVYSAAPQATAANPLAFLFDLDASILPGGLGNAPVQILADATPVAACKAAGTADPNPCVESETADDSPARSLQVLSTQAKTWAFARFTGSCGNPNNDGSITATDALFVLRGSVKTVACPMVMCDVNGDGRVVATDSLAVLRRAVNPQVVLTCSIRG